MFIKNPIYDEKHAVGVTPGCLLLYTLSLNMEKEILIHIHHPKNNCRPAAVGLPGRHQRSCKTSSCPQSSEIQSYTAGPPVCRPEGHDLL